MFDVMADWMNMPLLAHRYMGGAPKRLGLTHSFIAPYGAFKCKDNQILLSIQSNREFKIFCEKVLLMPNLVTNKYFKDNPSRFKNKEKLNEIINDYFSKFEADIIINLLNENNIANAKLNSVKELSEHQFLNNGLAKIGNTTIELANLPVLSKDTPNYVVPELGEHTKLITDEFFN